MDADEDSMGWLLELKVPPKHCNISPNRILKIASRIIKPTQTTFLLGRNIMEDAILLHETLHELHTKKQNGVIFKIDFEKAYDKFDSGICQGSNVSIKVNDQLGSFFQTKKGLRQGDPLSPILFNIVADILAIIMSRAKTNVLVKGDLPNLVDDHDMEQAKNMKLILCLFEQLSGLKIIFHKSEIFCFGQVPRGVLEKIEYFRSRFFWHNDNHKKKYRLIKWPMVCQPKQQGGLGVQNLDIQNKCLLSKWLFKLCNEDNIW
ncbi:hypothetical protein U9M48_031180 [Paspalum notatum var. saurae]|uniref:Reverse transcriptase domain-containing protein n=1 Tax=Paspalum notatum var. saurae TaxID=547442 RepID=A0AAQ3U247_PASNO